MVAFFHVPFCSTVFEASFCKPQNVFCYKTLLFPHSFHLFSLSKSFASSALEVIEFPLGAEAATQVRTSRRHDHSLLTLDVLPFREAKNARSKNATRNKCIATSNKCLTSSNKKLLVTRALLLGARTLLGAPGLTTRNKNARSIAHSLEILRQRRGDDKRWKRSPWKRPDLDTPTSLTTYAI